MNIGQRAFRIQFQWFAPEIIAKGHPLLTHYLIDLETFIATLPTFPPILGMGNANFF
jgi:hypothetical protein